MHPRRDSNPQSQRANGRRPHTLDHAANRTGAYVAVLQVKYTVYRTDRYVLCFKSTHGVCFLILHVYIARVTLK